MLSFLAFLFIIRYILSFSYRARGKSLPDIIYENIGQNRVSTS